MIKLQFSPKLNASLKKLADRNPVLVGISRVRMSSMNTSVSSTMNAKTTTETNARKVVKKAVAGAAVTPVVATTVAATTTTPVAATEGAAKKVTKRATSATVASTAVASTTVASATVVPEAVTDVVTDATVTTFADEIGSLQTQLLALRDGATAALASLKRVAKRASQEVKDARKNRRRARAETAEGEVRKPSNFEIPVPISDELSLFLGGGKSNNMSRAQVTKAINAYVNEHKLRVKHDITPDAALRKLLSVDESVKLTIFNMQTYLGRHYLKPAAKTTA
jgi:chromatin remodeling complex protein RSC6